MFVDVELATFNIDPALVEAAISPRTKAILAVHQLGMPCDLAALVSIAKRRGIPLVEDAACAIGSEINWQGQWERIGRPHGDIACFSFHPRKLLSTGDGGMLTTRDPELDRAVPAAAPARHERARRRPPRVDQVIFEDYPVVGYNYRMTDIQAAIGREQLQRLPAIVARRRELAARYELRLQAMDGLIVPREPRWARSNWQSYAVRLGAWIDQRAVMQRMLDAGVSTRRGAMNVHQEASYPRGSWRAGSALAVSEEAHDTAIVLPLFHQLTEEDQDRVIVTLESAIRAYRTARHGIPNPDLQCFPSSPPRSTRPPIFRRCTRASSRRWAW